MEAPTSIPALGLRLERDRHVPLPEHRIMMPEAAP
jgi:hypothetical protein